MIPPLFRASISRRFENRCIEEVVFRAFLSLTIFAMFFSIPASISFAKSNKPANEKQSKKHGPAAKTVLQFCTLDALGMRTPAWSGTYIDTFITWEIEPGWDAFVVIKRFSVVKEEYRKDKAFVTVRYFVKCNLVNTETMECQKVNKEKDMKYTVIKIKGAWKITDPDDWEVPMPHVFEGVITGYYGIGGKHWRDDDK